MSLSNLFLGQSANPRNAYVAVLERQVGWQCDAVKRGGIDQTRLSIDDAPSGQSTPFSFSVIGDTDPGIASSSANFSSEFVQQLNQEIENSRFLLHTGDITYPTGTYENYFNGFLKPYGGLLSRSPKSARYDGQSIAFSRPFLPVPGNHDCGKTALGVWERGLLFLCDRLRRVGIDLGHYGGSGGEAYGQTFLDNLAALSPQQLTEYLAIAYSARCDANSDIAEQARYCLRYRPRELTRLPNRYYQFHYGGIDFFALDSNSWNTSDEQENFDRAQLDWLEEALVSSWQNRHTTGRILYLHHSPYTTEELRWQQPETLWVRRHLRAVLNRVRSRLGATLGDEARVDLVISGHAHCLEHVKSMETRHADGNIDWLVCGGSGAGLRRQRRADANILERLTSEANSSYKYTDVVAKSQMYVGRHRDRGKEQHLHTFVRIDVRPDKVQRFSIQPFAVVKGIEGWRTEKLKTIHINRASGAIAATNQKLSVG